MKGTVILSVTLDLLAVAVMFVPTARFARYSKEEKKVRQLKWIIAGILLASGFLIDRYITHAGG
jgi:hypothetical protein